MSTTKKTTTTKKPATKKSTAKKTQPKKTPPKKSTTTSKKKQVTRGKKKKLSFYQENKFAIMLAYYVFAAFSFLLAVISGSGIWAILRQSMFAFFGSSFVILSVILAVIATKIAFHKLDDSVLKSNICAMFLMCSLSGLIHIVQNAVTDPSFALWSEQLKSAFNLGWKVSEQGLQVTGGFIGAVFGGTLLFLLPKIAAIIATILIFIVCLIIYSENGFNYIGMRVSQIMNDKKASHDEHSQENKIKREEKMRAFQEKKEQQRQEKAELERKRKEQELEEKRKLEEFNEKSRQYAQQNKEDSKEEDSQAQKVLLNSPVILNALRNIPKDNSAEPDKLFTYELNDQEWEAVKEIRRNKSSAFSNTEVDLNFESARTQKLEQDEQAYEEIVDDVLNQDFEEQDAKPITNPFIKQKPPETQESKIFSSPSVEEEFSNDDQRILQDAIDTAKQNAEKNMKEVEQGNNEIKKRHYVLPPLDCLNEPKFNNDQDFTKEMRITSRKLLDSLKSFNVETKLIGISHGPSVTRYELQPALGVKIKKITGLSDDIALSLAASGVRIEAPIPGKSAVGIEIPNKVRSTVTLREIISSQEFKDSKSKINVALGKDISGEIACADLAKMPHLLIAGTTGSGKSVCLNSMIASILYNATSEEVKMLMIDPKQVELSVYNGIPHLLVPVISDARKAAGSLAWAVGEMENRYKLFSTFGVRDIHGFNKEAARNDELEYMPQIVIFIDELNDLMMLSPKEVEDSICRLAQKARAAGMHLVVATQRPSVDVITGIIKANIPSRISLSVSSQIDSRTILDTAGAEKLLGNGDMLYNPTGVAKPIRIQGAYLSDEEIQNIVEYIKQQENAKYDDDIMQEIEKNAVVENKKKSVGSAGDNADGLDARFEEALEIVVECESASTSLLQRRMKLGYSRAARIMDEMFENGIIGPPDGSKPRKVMITPSQLLEMKAASEEEN